MSRRRIPFQLLVAALFMAASPDSRAADPGGSQTPLAISLQTSPDLFPWWETACRNGDWLVAREASAFQNRCGGRVVIFPSVAQAEATVPSIASGITAIGYDPEHWPQTPEDEKADLAAACKRLRSLADRWGLEAHVGPDRAFAISDGVRMAPYVDVFALQLQNFTNDFSAIHQFADPLIGSLRAANPSVKLQVQLRTDLAVPDLVTISRMLDIDTVSVLYQATSVGVVQSFVTALRSDQPAGVWFLPSSAHLPGIGGASWTTDLTVANTGASDALVTLKFLAHDIDGRSGAERSFPLGAGTSTTWGDILAATFGERAAYGAIRISSDSLALVAAGETSTPGGGGTYGQMVPALGPNDWITNGSSKSIVGVREDGSFRTNLVLANVTETSIDVAVTLVAESGASLGGKTYALAPLGMTQVTRVVRDLGVMGDLRGARLVLSAPTVSGAFAAYASLIDNVTNDPRTLLSR